MHDSWLKLEEAITQFQQSVGLYPTSGTSDDYAFIRNNLILLQTRFTVLPSSLVGRRQDLSLRIQKCKT